MKRIAGTWPVRALALAITAALGIGLTMLAHQASAATTPSASLSRKGSPPPHAPSAGVPSAIAPPRGSVVVAVFRVSTGSQVYQCTAGAWTFKAPEATLVGRAGHKIHHFGGPSWQSLTDNSLVTATKAAESAVPGSIPQLLLKVATHTGPANGELSRVTFIQRLRTSGGASPTGACTTGATAPVAYHADYVFFASP